VFTKIGNSDTCGRRNEGIFALDLLRRGSTACQTIQIGLPRSEFQLVDIVQNRRHGGKVTSVADREKGKSFGHDPIPSAKTGWGRRRLGEGVPGERALVPSLEVSEAARILIYIVRPAMASRP
jgi:hypothetical protein